MEQKIIIPKLDKKVETFDNKIFNNHSSSRYDIKTDSEYKVYTRAKIGFAEVTYFNDSYFKRIKTFYPTNGSIRQKGLRFNNGSEYGIWYHYDENGNFVKEENTDEGYDFGWLDVIGYCNEHNIKLEKGYLKRGINNEIRKIEEEGKKVWTIIYCDIKQDQAWKVTLDGKTGKELKRIKMEYIIDRTE